MVVFSDQDIRRECGSSAFEAGRIYYRQARVYAYAREDDRIHASVKGSQKQPYRQAILLTPKGSGASVAGHCTCPIGHNCKHVAAALLHGLTVASTSLPNPSSEAARHLATHLAGSIALAGTPDARMPVAPRAEEPELPASVLTWLDDLARAAVSAGEDYPVDILQRMIYAVRPVADGRKLPALGLQTIAAKLKKDGSWAQGSRPYTPVNAYQPQPKYLRPSDHRILRNLAALPYDQPTKTYRLGGEIGEEVLAKVLETGRARWLTIDGPPLHPGPPRRGRISWQAVDDSAVLPQLEVEGDAILLAATPPVYVDVTAGTVGPIDTGQLPRIAAALFRAPPVSAVGISALNAKLSARLPSLAALAPPTPETERRSGLRPVPALRLYTALLPIEIRGGYNRYGFTFERPRETVALARLSFRYGSIETPHGETRPNVTRFHGGRLIEIERDPEVESDAAAAMESFGFRPVSETRDGVPPSHAHDFLPEGDELAWFDTLYRVLPQLKAKGWSVDVAPDFPVRLAIADGDVDAEVVEGSGIDWLELHLGVSIDGERVDLVGPIVTMISAPGFSLEALERLAEDDGDPVYLPLDDGRILALPLGRLRPIIYALRDLAFGRDGSDGRLRLDRMDAARLAEFEAATLGAAMVWRGGEAIRDLGRKLTAHGGIPSVPVPATFRAELRPYQAEGVSWLALLREVGLGGILADDMGLGKTVQALAFLAIEKEAGRLDRPALVVAPTSLMFNWRREAERFAPDLRVLTLHGLARKALFDQIPDHDIVLTTYPLIARDREVLAAHDWHVLMLDEAQTIKNPDAANDEADPVPRGAPSVLPDRHAARKSSRRTLVPVLLRLSRPARGPQEPSRPPGERRSRRPATPSAVGCWPGASSHSCSDAPRNRWRATCRRRRSSWSASNSRRRSATSTTPSACRCTRRSGPPLPRRDGRAAASWSSTHC